MKFKKGTRVRFRSQKDLIGIVISVSEHHKDYTVKWDNNDYLASYGSDDWSIVPEADLVRIKSGLEKAIEKAKS